MPRRSSARNQCIQLSPPPQLTALSPPPALSEPLVLLRRQWKWAAFSQFYFTFNQLFQTNEIALSDIEDDLVRGSSVVLPRIMQRLLYTLSYDRKVSLDNWQTALRKQYRKRDHAANPIGPEPRVPSPEPRSSSPAPDVENPPAAESVTRLELYDDKRSSSIQPEFHSYPANVNADLDTDGEMHLPESTCASTLELDRGLGFSAKALSVQPSESDSLQAPSGSHLEDQEESKNWLELPMLTKLDSMYLVTEWQFQNPTRLRTLMRSDNDDATWRIEPIGYDSKKNAYWLIGSDRLWLQHPIPRPRPTKPNLQLKATSNAKAKAKLSTSRSKSLKRKGDAGPSHLSSSKSKYKRPRLQDASASPSKLQPTLAALSGTGRGRAAKLQANLKLDAQAKELTELNRQAAELARLQSSLRSSRRGQVASSLTADNDAIGGSPSRTGKERDRAIGIRISARLRGSTRDSDDGEWQAVPQEWLAVEGSNGKGEEEVRLRDAAVRTGLESEGSEISDLTELSEDQKSTAETNGEDEEEEAEHTQEGKKAKQVDDWGIEDPPVLPEGFIEWETICVTLSEWEHIAERFAKATHYLEKALYKILVNQIVPVVTEDLREAERKQRLSLAVTQRKRSSRLLLRQSEREEAEAVARKLAEEEERHSRARRAEARQRKEEADRERREAAREMRRERVEREGMTGVGVDDKAKGNSLQDINIDVLGDKITSQGPQLTRPPYNGALLDSRFNDNGHHGAVTPLMGSGSRTPAGDDWELDCEVCHRHGVNLDDGTPMMSCGLCSKWQHIACHDHADHQAGRVRRNWDVVEFFCLKCRKHRGFPDPGDSGVQLGASAGSGTGEVQSTMGFGTSQLDQTPYLGQAYASVGGTSYGVASSNPYVGGVANGPATVNGSYARDQHVSNVRSAPSFPGVGDHSRQHQQQRQPQPQPSSPRRQSYGVTTTIAFSHYQPQQRGFSSPLQQQQYNASGHTQPYGHHAITTSSQYGHPMSNGSGQPYQRQTSQTRWNFTTSPQQTSALNTMPYVDATPAANINSAVGHYLQHSTMMTPQPSTHTQTQWQHSNRLVEPQNVNIQPQQIQHRSQFKYHPTSYQSQTSS